MSETPVWMQISAAITPVTVMIGGIIGTWLKFKYDEKFRSFRETSNIEIATLKTNYTAAIAKLKSDYEAAIAILKAENATEIATLKTGYETRVVKLETDTQHITEKGVEYNKTIIELKTVIAKLEAEIVSLKAEIKTLQGNQK